jgi:hypothetical protein
MGLYSAFVITLPLIGISITIAMATIFNILVGRPKDLKKNQSPTIG